MNSPIHYDYIDDVPVVGIAFSYTPTLRTVLRSEHILHQGLRMSVKVYICGESTMMEIPAMEARLRREQRRLNGTRKHWLILVQQTEEGKLMERHIPVCRVWMGQDFDEVGGTLIHIHAHEFFHALEASGIPNPLLSIFTETNAEPKTLPDHQYAVIKNNGLSYDGR